MIAVRRMRKGETEKDFMDRMRRKHSRFPYRWSIKVGRHSIGCIWARHVSWGSDIRWVRSFGEFNYFYARKPHAR